ncbi:hypothetical protein MPSEU_000608100 [Mayamaea pseudoterrestris]|nr:hypothetical protein MPSEU_000608100 [Mayamaea pseudoterrestris]
MNDLKDMEAPPNTETDDNMTEEAKKRKRDQDVVIPVGDHLRASDAAKTLASPSAEASQGDNDGVASAKSPKKRKTQPNDARPRTRRSCLPTVLEVPSPFETSSPPSIRMETVEVRRGEDHVVKQVTTTSQVVAVQANTTRRSNANRVNPPPPPPPPILQVKPSVSSTAVSAAAVRCIPPPPPPPPLANAFQANPVRNLSMRNIPPPPPPRQAVAYSAPRPAHQASFQPAESNAALTADKMHVASGTEYEGDDAQPSLAEAESNSFDSPSHHGVNHEEELELEATHQHAPRSILRRLLHAMALLTAGFCLLLVAVSLGSDTEPGLHLHIMLPEQNGSMLMDEDALKEYWKKHAPSQAVELFEHVEYMNEVEEQQQQRGDSNNSLQLGVAPMSSTGAAPMCVSFLVQSVSDLLAATNIKVSFPEIMIKHSMDGSEQRLLGGVDYDTSSEGQSSHDGSKALVPFSNSQLEGNLLSRMTAFKFPLFAWSHAGDQHVVVVPDQHQQKELPTDAKLLSMEIRPCDEDDYEEEEVVENETVSGKKTKKKRRRKRKILKRAARKIQEETDKLMQGVQDTGKKIQQGIGGIKNKTGNLLMNVASWHKHKKWL